MQVRILPALLNNQNFEEMTAEEIAHKIFYMPATNGKAGISLKEGTEMIEAYAREAIKADREKSLDIIVETKPDIEDGLLDRLYDEIKALPIELPKRK